MKLKPQLNYQYGESGWMKGQPTGYIRNPKKPSLNVMKHWLSTGIARATDGCKVEPDGYCEHNQPSWLIKLGLI